MARCETCGNEYRETFEVVREGERHIFDCFECAIHAMAPVCAHCGCRVIGHGVQDGGEIFCCEHCQRNGARSASASPVAAHM